MSASDDRSRHHTLQEAISLHPFPNLPFLPEYRPARQLHLDGQRHLLPEPEPTPSVIEDDIFIKARDGYDIRTKCYRPTSSAIESLSNSHDEKQRPLIVLFHEGGWVMGNSTDEDSNARTFAKELGAVCLNPEYRLAPENPFPTGVLDCWDVLQWAAANVDQLSVDLAKGFIVGGSSAGANIAAVLAHRAAREKLDPPLTGQWLCVPYLLPPELVPSKYQERYTSMWANRSDPVLGPLLDGPETMKTTGFIPELVKADVLSPLFSPFADEWYPPRDDQDTTPAHRTLIPKAFFQVAGLDPLRDHGLIYRTALAEEWKVETRLNLYEGFGHMFWTNWPQLERSRDYWKDMVEGIRWLLEDQ
ncbi:Alpha/Beta hydrolase protein [Ilyonectria destructans]|nr:Alpha/Beta hydrolase protein [Ilyonectria destructans]